jgi:protein ImuB
MPTARKTPALTRVDTPTPPAGHARRKAADHPQRALALEAPVTTAPAARAARRLWFCIHLPYLPLEAGGTAAAARVVVEERQGMHRVLLACPRAAAAGIQPGQSPNAALALLPELGIEERSELKEQQAVEALAAWLEQFTSVVCIAARDVLLLEIAGSLRLYGGLLRLRRQLVAGLGEQGFSASVAISPTPLAATWLARAGHRTCVREPANLPAALRPLSLACLDWPAATCEALAGVGVTTLGDCLRLPREGFARRFGHQRLIELDRALGRLPDPRRSWRAPEVFRVDYEMTEEQSDRDVLLGICRELLQSLERFLLTRQLGTLQLTFTFFHLHAPATRVSLGCARAERRADHWFDLLGIRFERVKLAEPVIAVELHGGRHQALQAESGRLALDSGSGRQRLRYSVAQLAERLIARIGHQSVQGVVTVAEHRPHRAWRLRNLLGDSAAMKRTAVRCRIQRPLWMLPEPALLRAEEGYPLHHGRLSLVEGPERLETGWWDDDGVARDYYTAVNPCGMRLWVFRNRSRSGDWYLHGFFG